MQDGPFTHPSYCSRSVGVGYVLVKTPHSSCSRQTNSLAIACLMSIACEV